VLLAGAVLLTVLLAGESSRAMLASARLSCFLHRCNDHCGGTDEHSIGSPNFILSVQRVDIRAFQI